MRKFFPFICFIFLAVSCGQKTSNGNTSGTNDKIAVQTTVTDSMPAEESDESVKRFTIFKKSGKEYVSNCNTNNCDLNGRKVMMSFLLMARKWDI